MRQSPSHPVCRAAKAFRRGIWHPSVMQFYSGPLIHFSPALTLQRRADDDQDALRLLLEPGLQMDAVGPAIDVALCNGAAIAVAKPALAKAGGALGFWKALGEVWPTTREQRCWNRMIRPIRHGSSARSEIDKSPANVAAAPHQSAAQSPGEVLPLNSPIQSHSPRPLPHLVQHAKQNHNILNFGIFILVLRVSHIFSPSAWGQAEERYRADRRRTIRLIRCTSSCFFQL